MYGIATPLFHRARNDSGVLPVIANAEALEKDTWQSQTLTNWKKANLSLRACLPAGR